MFGFWNVISKEWFSANGNEIFATPDEGVALANLPLFEKRAYPIVYALTVRVIGPDGQPA